MLGILLLRKFNLIFDYQNERIFIEPALQFGQPFLFNLTGLELIPDRNWNLTVQKVYPGSPADQAGIKVNDLITEINSQPIQSYKPGELHQLLMQQGQTVLLQIKSRKIVRKISIVLQDIL